MDDNCYEKMWKELRREVLMELHKCDECKDLLDNLFNTAFDTQQVRCLKLAYDKVFCIMTKLEEN